MGSLRLKTLSLEPRVFEIWNLLDKEVRSFFYSVCFFFVCLCFYFVLTGVWGVFSIEGSSSAIGGGEEGLGRR